MIILSEQGGTILLRKKLAEVMPIKQADLIVSILIQYGWHGGKEGETATAYGYILEGDILYLFLRFSYGTTDIIGFYQLGFNLNATTHDRIFRTPKSLTYDEFTQVTGIIP